MASTKNHLYSVGPGSIGPGTSVVRSVLSPQRESGVVTRMYQDENGISVSALASLYGLSESVFPGTSIALDYTRVKQLSDTLALVVSYYGKSSSSSGFRTVMTRTSGGYRQEPYWKVGGDYTSNKDNYQDSNPNKSLKPNHIITIPLVSVRWSDVVYSDSRPSVDDGLVGKINSSTVTIDGYSYAGETLKYGGAAIRHDKYGGYDRWTINHTATADPFYKWKTSDPPTRGDRRPDGTFNFTLVNGGNGTQYHSTASFSGVT